LIGVFDRGAADAYPLETASFPGSPVVSEPGEGQKTWAGVESIIKLGVSEGMNRDGIITGVGGGVICDVAAFAASVYNRGCRLVLVPTTLLAMVDAALGGKTGINFAGYKNLVGTFYPADEVRIYVPFLERLPGREYKSGMAEVIKTAFLGEPQLKKSLEQEKSGWINKDPDILLNGIQYCLGFKGRVVEADLREGGNRAFLNFGHTFGHALEASAGLGRITHGEAVAWGMAKALEAGVEIGITNPAYRDSCCELMESYGFDTGITVTDPHAFAEALLRDKKNRKGEVRFILQRDFGDTVITPLDPDLVRRLVSS
jgi:3-dehydroquinate synthase